MEKIGVLFCCLLVGIILQRIKQLPKDLFNKLNTILIFFFIPCLIVQHIPETTFLASYHWPILTSWVVFVGSVLFFGKVISMKKTARKTIGGLMVTSGIGSISFVGFPIFELLYGAEGLKLGIIMSTAGTFVICVTAGITVSSYYASKNPELRGILYRMITFPPFIAFIISVLLNLNGYKHSQMFKNVLQNINVFFPYISFITIGLAVKFSIKELKDKNLLLGLLYKLVIAPLLVGVLLYSIGIKDKTLLTVCVMGAGIGSMNTIAIIAMKLDLDPKLCSKMVGVSIPLSIPLLFLIYVLLN